jgi:hypothetical protein
MIEKLIEGVLELDNTVVRPSYTASLRSHVAVVRTRESGSSLESQAWYERLSAYSLRSTIVSMLVWSAYSRS